MAVGFSWIALLICLAVSVVGLDRLQILRFSCLFPAPQILIAVVCGRGEMSSHQVG